MQDLDSAWVAYQAILETHGHGSRLFSPRQLHGLSAMLSKIRPKTRQTYLRLLSVISELRNLGHSVYQWELNALVASAGKGFRKTRIEDYEAAINTLSLPLPSHHLPKSKFDIVTFNTLLSVAARTLSPRIMQHALSLLNDHPHLRPNRNTHLSLLQFYALTDQSHLVPGVLDQMIKAELEIGVDGINAVIWAYARSGALDVALNIFGSLGNIPPDSPASLKHVPVDRREPLIAGQANSIPTDNPILCIPGLSSQLRNLEPNHITFTLLIQCLSYHGDLYPALSLLRTMLSRVGEHSKGGKSPPSGESEALLIVFRSIFLGFVRFGVQSQSPPLRDNSFGLSSPLHRVSARLKSRCKSARTSPDQHSPWVRDILAPLFDSFLALHSPTGSSQSTCPRSHQRVFYWGLLAFSQTSGHDPSVVAQAWRKMQSAFHLGLTESNQPRITGRLRALVQELIDA